VALGSASREEDGAEVLSSGVKQQGEPGTTSLHGLKMRVVGGCLQADGTAVVTVGGDGMAWHNKAMTRVMWRGHVQVGVGHG
jgi:hypothetical protein